MRIEALHQDNRSVFQNRPVAVDAGRITFKTHGTEGHVDRQERRAASGQDERKQLEQAVEKANSQMQNHGVNVRLRTSDKSERFQVEVIDQETKEVLRRFPPDEIIRLAESLDEMVGVILNRSL